MAENRKLDSIVTINGESYEVIAETAKKLENKLTIKVVNGTTEEYTFDGSETKSIELKAISEAGHAATADTAEVANKLKGTLTIKTAKDGQETTDTFDGSTDKTIEVGDANKIKVNMDNDRTAYATITISKNDPVADEGSVGNIWFKYN